MSSDSVLLEVERNNRIIDVMQMCVLNRRFQNIAGSIGVSGPDSNGIDDEALVGRVRTSFVAASELEEDDPSSSMWSGWIAEAKKKEVDCLLAGSLPELTKMLRNPRESNLFTGFDDLIAGQAFTSDQTLEAKALQDWLCRWAYDALVRLAEAVGVVALENPEHHRTRVFEPDDLLKLLDKRFGFEILFADPFPGRVGLKTSRGIATFRAVNALYQAWRTLEYVNFNVNARVVEIGAGLGRSAYYAHQLGLRDYTIIDIPLTGVAQGYFLGRIMGDGAVSLYGEKDEREIIRILPPSSFLLTSSRYDIVVNVDSMTEMGQPSAQAYCDKIASCSDMFYSVNHEFNEYRVFDLMEGKAKNFVRSPYWLRRGYAEELFRID